MADKTPPESVHPGYKVEGNDLDGYVGVSPEYQTYADDTSKPFVADEERELFDNAKTAEKEAVVELNEYGLPVGDGSSPFEKAPARGTSDAAKDDEKESDSDDDSKETATKPASARTTTSRTAASK